MTTPIVLIEIENGMIQVYADKNVLVATHDYDTEGNDLGRIDRENNEAAFVKLTEKLDAHSGTGANEALEVFESRATTDWGKEFERIADLRGKAIAEMQNHIPHGRNCTLSIPSRHGHIVTVLNLPDHGIGFVTEESNITLWPHKVDTEYLFQAAHAVTRTIFK